MSKHRTHPVFSVTAAGLHGCGHQHSTPYQAVNCARGQAAHHHRSIDRFQIVQYDDEGRSKDIETLIRVDPCSECGGSLVKSTMHELGHANNCPLAGHEEAA